MVPSDQDFAGAVLLTTERELPNGEPWCPPRDAAAVKSWLADRSKPLGGGLRQLVRLIRLMARSDRRDYTSFLYARLPALRTRFFEREIKAAHGNGMLAGIAELTPSGMTMIEPNMCAGSQPFNLDFVQMPRLAALLDILHNALGYGSVDEIVSGLTGREAAAQADAVAREIQRALDAWLSERLGSSHQMRQAKLIRSFLARSSRLKPDAITDDTIFDLWACYAADPQAEGFRLFRSAARLTIRYKHTLSLEATKERVLKASGFDPGEEFVNAVDLDRLVAPGTDLADKLAPEDFVQGSGLDVAEWTSPAEILFSPPADRVKWLTKVDRSFLEDLLGSPDIDRKHNAGISGSLFGRERFEPIFIRTLLRCMSFGDFQNTLVQRMRRGESYENVELDADDYDTIRSHFGELLEESRSLVGAAAFVLIRAKILQGFTLAQSFMGDEFRPFVFSYTGSDDGNSLRGPQDLMAVLVKAFADSDREPVKKIANAFRKINREGFRKQDLTSDYYVEGIAAGGDALSSLHAELERVVACLHRIDLGCFVEDKALFDKQFAELYKRI